MSNNGLIDLIIFTCRINKLDPLSVVQSVPGKKIHVGHDGVRGSKALVKNRRNLFRIISYIQNDLKINMNINLVRYVR